MFDRVFGIDEIICLGRLYGPDINLFDVLFSNGGGQHS